ncbi:MAG: chromosome segregation protein SMC [Fimbriimonadaceae bacterium]|nr:chromosome segregation protein SMC [Fimbriimonadaceae bacterium]
MRLKRIRLYGFKTFAERTDISLDGDIVAIVGPNGCGKSNIVDALVWGLGESNMRSVRAQTGKEVVFAGSSHRKPLGYAEVSVSFDNEDGMLPLDSAEVTTTRRVTREGENSYQINRRNCRLRDVTELLADTGLSRTGYAIVSQSEIDQALSASTLQRRHWIDEAAGVQRYRLRRIETMRRLAAAAEHLARVDDVIVELEIQREPLESEAKVALEYRELAGRLRGIETGLLAHELVDATNALAEATARAESISKALASEKEICQTHLREEQEALSEAETLEAEISEARARAAECQRRTDLARTAIEVARARLASLTDLEAALEVEGNAGLERLAQAEADLAGALSVSEAEARSLAEARAEAAGTREEETAVKSRLAEAEARLAADKELDVLRRTFEIEQAHRERRALELERELAGAKKAVIDLAGALAAAELDAGQATERYATAKQGLEDALLSATEGAKSLEAAMQSHRELLARIATLEGKRAGLQASLAAHDGLSAGSMAVMEASRNGEIQGEFVPIGEALTVDPAYAIAMDAALGAAANDLIVKDEAVAKSAISFLRENRAGRATFQPLTLVQPRGASGAERLKGQPGVIGVASRLVECPDRFKPVIEGVLGRTVVVETLDAGFRLVGKPGWSKAVTLEGEIVFAGGAVTGGRASRQGNGMVERAAALASAELELEVLTQELGQAESAIAELQTSGQSRQTEREEADTALAALATARDEALAFRNAILSEHRETERACARLETERVALATPLEAPAEADLAATEAAREAALREWAELSARASGQTAALDAAEARAGAAAQRVEDLRRRLEAVAEAIASGKARRENVGPETETLNRQLADSEAEQEKWQRELDLESEEVEKRSEARAQAQARAREAGQAASASRSALTAAESEAHKLEIAMTRQDLKRAATAARLLEEYGLDEASARNLANQGRPESDAANLVASLRKQIKGMGEVNLGSIDAFERVTSRLHDLTSQRADVVDGKEQIEASIRELDALTRERFEATFEDVRRQFQETFVKVFEGGEADISLEGADDTLEAGVDIQVTLPGKRRQRLELLSGGERALGALTFLCSLLKVRPSPLVVLDEVDAPLDGRNVERFVTLLRSFEGRSQFVVVTHNQVTIENSDVWLGVSMQEPGVSTVIPFRAPQGTSPEHALAGGYLKG